MKKIIIYKIQLNGKKREYLSQLKFMVHGKNNSSIRKLTKFQNLLYLSAGILFTNSPTTLEQYNTSISSARALGGLGPVQAHDHDHHHDHDHDHNHEHQQDVTTQVPTHTEHGPETQSDEAHEHSIGSEESGDTSLYGQYCYFLLFCL